MLRAMFGLFIERRRGTRRSQCRTRHTTHNMLLDR